jgi:menaquinone-dependent protoporphyrinogen oxidase
MTKPVLVSYGSKYGATEQIAHRIGQVLGEAGLHVDVRSAADVEDLGPYRAVVIGSAVYAGQWRKEAAAFVRRHQEELRALPAAHLAKATRWRYCETGACPGA